jgi:RNA polymerase sigma-70 factor (ECF subfamily)
LFELLVRNFHRTARVWARRILDDDDLVEDAVQEALIIAFERLHQLRRPEAVAGWLKQIVVRQCYRHVQQLRRGREYERGEGHLPESPLDPAEVAEQTDES